MALLRAGHYDIRLGPDEWHALAAWIDCNAPLRQLRRPDRHLRG